MSTTNNLAGLKPIPVTSYSVSGSDIVKYLTDRLGFTFGYEFGRFPGIIPQLGYTWMRVVFDPKDIQKDAGQPKTIVERAMSDSATGLKFNPEFMEVIKPFMYPQELIQIRNNPNHPKAELLRCHGLFGANLDAIVAGMQLTISKPMGYWQLHLMPEKIIGEMLKDPATGEIDGVMKVVESTGDSSDTLRLLVSVSKVSAFDKSINMSRLFKLNSVS